MENFSNYCIGGYGGMYIRTTMAQLHLLKRFDHRKLDFFKPSNFFFSHFFVIATEEEI